MGILQGGRSCATGFHRKVRVSSERKDPQYTLFCRNTYCCNLHAFWKAFVELSTKVSLLSESFRIVFGDLSESFWNAAFGEFSESFRRVFGDLSESFWIAFEEPAQESCPLTITNCLFPLDRKNNVFVSNICKYALCESQATLATLIGRVKSSIFVEKPQIDLKATEWVWQIFL